ncbi:hypothetical protein OC846_006667 [Tilletia horrida]|uniref:C2H2-type domain-containing protein n=1 Tax=Tilletia horrida TaxID=155126 RepID=A0AAN6GIE8_9BASI|nr:hypothetical protein OC846_006667 [Tilletia horrida]
MTFECPLCFRSYSLRKTLAFHLHNKHPQQAEAILRQTDTHANSVDSPFHALIAEWRRLPNWHPQRQSGLQVLQHLLNARITLTPPLRTDIHDSFSLGPTLVHIYEDLRVGSDIGIISTSSGTVAPHLSQGHFHASLHAVETRDLMGMNPNQLCAVNMVLPSPNGLEACSPRHAPWRKEHGSPTQDQPEGSFAYCPKGHITDLHQDSIFEGRFVTVLFGRKLFLTWPTSSHNLQTYAEIHGHFSGFALPSLLPRLHGLQATLHTHGSVGYMPPGTIHAVLNLDSAATFAYDVIHEHMLPDIMRVSAWERRVAQELIRSGDHTDTVSSIQREHKAGMRLWKAFALASDKIEILTAVRDLLLLLRPSF